MTDLKGIKLHLICFENIPSSFFSQHSSTLSFPPPHFIHTLSGHHASLVKAPNFHDSCIGLMWVSWPDLQGALIKEGDRLLAISFVYSSEQSSAKVERRKQSTD